MIIASVFAVINDGAGGQFTGYKQCFRKITFVALMKLMTSEVKFIVEKIAGCEENIDRREHMPEIT